MKNKKNRIVKIAIISMLFAIFGLAVLAGCGNKKISLSENKKAKTSAVESTNSKLRTIIDMAGRKVEIPKEIKKIYSINPMGCILVYTIAPDTLLGWSQEIDKESIEFIPEKYRKLPILGSMDGQNSTANVEQIISLKPDLIIMMKNTINDSVKNKAEKLTKQLCAPIVVVENNLDKTSEIYKFMGDLLGATKQGEKLTAYYEKTMKVIEEGKKQLEGKNKVRVYYGSEQDGLSTGSINSPHAQLIELVGGINVANSNRDVERFRTSIEQVMLWNPQMILITEKKQNEAILYEKIMNSEEWKKTDAVKNKRVFKAPSNYFDWFDRPPTVNRILGINWLANLLYPNVYKIDIKKEVKDFYELYYHSNLTDIQVEKLLN